MNRTGRRWLRTCLQQILVLGWRIMTGYTLRSLHGLLRIRERGERRSILVFLIYPTTVYCQSCFLKYVFVQRNQILLKIKLRSPSSFTVWAHSSHNNYERERRLKICDYFTLKPPGGERSHMETLCECEYKESAGKSKKFSQFSGLCKRAQYQDIECVCV